MSAPVRPSDSLAVPTSVLGAMPVQIRRILWPCDFSDLSRRALDHATVLARWYEASITALHVSLPAAAMGAYPYYYPEPGLHGPALRQRLMNDVAEVVKGLPDTGVQVDVEVEEGSAASEIVRMAGERRADLVVLATHGRHGFPRLLAGSVTETVVRKAPCPVLTVPPTAPGHAPAPSELFHRILCPVDFSPPSLRALEYALSLAEEADAELTLVHVLERSVRDSSPDPERREFCAAIEEDAHAALHAAVPEEARSWCRPVEVVASGEAQPEILRLARERGAGLIVMGVHGRGAVDVMLFGSTTRGVVRAAPCPVLTLRSS